MSKPDPTQDILELLKENRISSFRRAGKWDQEPPTDQRAGWHAMIASEWRTCAFASWLLDHDAKDFQRCARRAMQYELAANAAGSFNTLASAQDGFWAIVAGDVVLADRYAAAFKDVQNRRELRDTNADGEVVAASALLLLGIEPSQSAVDASARQSTLPYVRALFRAARAAVDGPAANVERTLLEYLQELRKYTKNPRSSVPELAPERLLSIEGLAIVMAAHKAGHLVTIDDPSVPRELVERLA